VRAARRTFTGRIIVLADRGTCTFTLKARNAQGRRASGPSPTTWLHATPPGFGGTDPLVTIGVLHHQAAAWRWKAALVAGSVSAHVPPHRHRAGRALDNTIVHARVGPLPAPPAADCGAPQCGAMSGWGDFIALHTIARDGDNLNGRSPSRRRHQRVRSEQRLLRHPPCYLPVDFTKNAFTFKHITDGVALPAVPTLPGGANSEVHNAGEIWTTMLQERMQRCRRRAARVSRSTMSGAAWPISSSADSRWPVDATYTEQRDAILGGRGGAAQGRR
jgi:hypothetical protein